MFGKSLFFLPALFLATVPGPAAAEALDDGPKPAVQQEDVGPAGKTGGQSYGDRNRGGRSGFYSYPRHRHVDGSSGGGGLVSRPFSSLDAGTSPYCESVNCHGSAWYGRDYGAPYHGGGYYDRGTYYRERRD